MNNLVIIIITLGLICFTNCKANDSTPPAQAIHSPPVLQSDVFQAVIDSLLNREVDPNFIKKYIESDKLSFSERYIKINVTGYLSKADYSYVTNQNSVKKSKEFIKKHLTTLTAAEKQYKVPKEIIAAIL